MKKYSTFVVRLVLLTGLFAGVTSCMVVNVNSPGHRHVHRNIPMPPPTSPAPTLDNTPWPPQNGYSEVFNPPVAGAPYGNSGSVLAQVSSFYSGSHACFPSSAGWDRYFPMPRYLIGPGVVPNSLSYTNIDQLSQCTISTCDGANPVTLHTAVVIYEEYNPNTDRVCASNSGCPNTQLTVNSRSIANGKRYRATVYFKSGELGNLQNVKVNWGYP